MEWSSGVNEAIATSRANNGVLIILVEPNSSITNPPPESEQSSENLLARLSTLSLHSKTFQNAAVQKAIKDSNSTCLKLIHDPTNQDFQSFSVYFKLEGIPPNLFFIAPTTGFVVYRKQGFVSPNLFLQCIATASKTVTGNDLPVDTNATIGSPSSFLVLTPSKKSQSTQKSHLSQTGESQPSDKDDESETNSSSLPVSTLHEGSKSMKLSSTPSSANESRLLARLPGGTQTHKSFSHTTLFSSVRSWLSDELKTPSKNLLISTPFPRRVFDAAHDSKMLSELDLVPSGTLNVMLTGNQQVSNDYLGPLNAVRNSNISGYATGAAQFIGGFFRSFVQDSPQEQDSEDQNNQRNQGGRSDSRSRNFNRTGRIQTARSNNDENLMSNGNSTQFGWNPNDANDDQR